MEAKDFDVVAYLNAQFSAGTADLNEISESLISAQLFKAKVCKELDESIESITNQLPRLIGEVENIVKQSCIVTQKLTDINDALDSVESQNLSDSGAFGELVNVEVVRRRIQDSLSLLKNFDRWNSLEQDVLAAVQSKAISRAVSLLHEAKQGIDDETLGNYSEKENKLALINSSAQKLEEALIPSLVSALSSFDFESISSLFEMFVKIDKQDSFFSCYNDSRKREIQKVWIELRTRLDPSKETQKFLTAFYEDLLAIIKREVNWSLYVFGSDIMRCVCGVLNGILGLSEPSFEEMVSSKFSASKTFEDYSEAVQLYTSTKTFLYRLEKLIKYRRDELLSASEPKYEWSLVIMKPFNGAQKQFVGTIQRIFKESFNHLFDSGDKRRPVTARLQDAVAFTFESAYKLIDLSANFTHHYALSAVLDVVFGEFEYLAKRIISIIAVEKKEALQSNGIAWNHYTQAIKFLEILRQSHTKLIKYYETFGTIVARIDDQMSCDEKYISVGAPSTFIDDERQHVSETGTASSLYYSKCTFNWKRESDLEIAFKQSKQLLELSMVNSVARSQEYLVVSILYPVLDELKNIPQMDVWYSDKANPSDSLALSGFEVPKFSLSPSSYSHKIGEHLLSLPQHLDITKDADNNNDYSCILGFMSGLLPQIYKNWPLSDSFCVSQDVVSSINEIPNDSDSYVSAHSWLISVCQITAKEFGNSIYSIKKGALTPKGLRQLITDLDYIFTIFSALGLYESDSGIEGFSELEVIFRTLKLLTASNDMASIIRKLIDEGSSSENIPQPEIQKLFQFATEDSLKSYIYNTAKLMK